MIRTIELTSNRGRKISLEVQGGIIISVSNFSGIHFPFVVNQPYNRNVEVWAENHNFLFDGEDLSKKDEKLFGIRVEHYPQGHPLRFIYPNKFR